MSSTFTTPGSTVQQIAGGWTRLYDSTLGASAASFDVAGIAQAYTHLKMMLNARGDLSAADVQVDVRFNGDSGGNYDGERLVWSGTTPTVQALLTAAANGVFGFIPAATANAGSGGSVEATLYNYAETVFQKNLYATSVEGVSTAAGQPQTDICTTRWRNTGAITQVTIFPDSGNFIAGSRLSIYGIV